MLTLSPQENGRVMEESCAELWNFKLKVQEHKRGSSPQVSWDRVVWEGSLTIRATVGDPCRGAQPSTQHFDTLHYPNFIFNNSFTLLNKTWAECGYLHTHNLKPVCWRWQSTVAENLFFPPNAALSLSIPACVKCNKVVRVVSATGGRCVWTVEHCDQCSTSILIKQSGY